jgi:DNA-binding winged helix-turn-helix (wHTH) protein/tetratricopeptide (TPR) repeat protein
MIYSFEKFGLDTSKLTLTRSGKEVAVEPQVFLLIKMLVESSDRAVTKEELMQTIWKGRYVTDAALSSRVNSARLALGDDGRKQAFIKTIYSIGFRFVAKVNVDRGSPITVNAAEIAEKSPHLSKPPSIMVLPFKWQIPQVDNVIPRGITHDIIAGLSKLKWLKVIAHGTSFKVSINDLVDGQVNSVINATYYLVGNLESHGAKTNFHLELGEIESRAVIWADTISTSSNDVNKIREDAISLILSSLELQISEYESSKAALNTSENLDAWQAYHLGMSHLNRFTKKDMLIAKELFGRSVSLDPNFARAHAGFSAAEFQDAFNGYSRDSLKEIGLATKHAEKSIEIDRLDPFANFVMGRSYWLRGQTAQSVPWLERAITLNPNYAQGFYAFGLASLMSDDSLRSYEESKRAISLSPMDPFMYGFLGIRAFSYLADKDFENACDWAEKAALQPESLPVMDLLAAACSELVGKKDRSQQWLEKARMRNPSISSNFFFQALPFGNTRVRNILIKVFEEMRV